MLFLSRESLLNIFFLLKIIIIKKKKKGRISFRQMKNSELFQIFAFKIVAEIRIFWPSSDCGIRLLQFENVHALLLLNVRACKVLIEKTEGHKLATSFPPFTSSPSMKIKCFNCQNNYWLQSRADFSSFAQATLAKSKNLLKNCQNCHFYALSTFHYFQIFKENA